MGKNGKLTGTERTELRRIVKGRFELLQKQLRIREHELKTAITNELYSEHKTRLKHYTEAVERNNKARKKLDEELETLHKLAAEENISINYHGEVRLLNELKRVEQELQKLLGEKLSVSYHLQELELKVLERLAVTGLDSIEAVEFLESIPELDQLLPSPEQLKLTK